MRHDGSSMRRFETWAHHAGRWIQGFPFIRRAFPTMSRR
jgi:hypothetical protein